MIKGKVAILGAGFTGLSAAYQLLKKGFRVTIFEKENDIGGLAKGFKLPGWKWSLENSYHHWFTNDESVLNLAKNLKHGVHIIRPGTDICVKDKFYRLDSPISLLFFKPLLLTERLRVGFFTFFLKLIFNPLIFEGKIALVWIKKYMGKTAAKLIWNPLFSAKFGHFKNKISLVWFWARIKKRTGSLAYPEGGFKSFTEDMSKKIKAMGGEIKLNCPVSRIKSSGDGVLIKVQGKDLIFDKVISTLPSSVFSKIARGCSANYLKRINSIDHLNAQVLILILKKPFMNKTYWLNITDKKFPFLVLVEHTNFIDKKFYSNQHILYVGNYLKDGHPFLKLDSEKLLKKFDPFLKKINPGYKENIADLKVFIEPFAQPIVTTDYLKKIPEFKTPLKNVYMANLDMVYPWDRGTNYAIELGQKIAGFMLSKP